MRLPESNCEPSEHGNFSSLRRRFRVKRVVVAKRSSKKRSIIQSCRHLRHLICHLGINSSEQSLVSSSPRHAFFILLIPLLIGLLQLDYQSKNESPFDTHPVNMWVFFGAASIYCLGLIISMGKNLQGNYMQVIISHVNLSFGALASISLASIFLPRLLGWLCLALWTLLPILLSARRFVKHKRGEHPGAHTFCPYQTLKDGTLSAISKASDKFRTFRRSLTLKKQDLPI